ncbi:heme-degrading monooxygenase HmoA [Streptomyces olivoverticillatus]|uniref:Heme-degrading monooxygenase HmoA n=1 Tax=Streptomyces olivoverticillatus TaxID=66427 RepID=A0A7W7LRM3_9ACTN|nr:antibiotic biosynthesis monooxygenase family protein [Streptomyces olivoverticillatus]MBB4895194.1 heme-degrading monooxygenase HmoA [Streptomyces olivoverticillatus]
MAHPEEVFRVLLRVETHPGKQDDFERTWLEIGNAVTGDPANLGQWLLRSTDEDHVYYIISDWTDEAGFRTFEHSAEHVTHRERLHPYRSGGSMATMRIVRHLPSARAAA